MTADHKAIAFCMFIYLFKLKRSGARVIVVRSSLAMIPLSCEIKMLFLFKETIIKFLNLLNPLIPNIKIQVLFTCSRKFVMEKVGRSR